MLVGNMDIAFRHIMLISQRSDVRNYPFYQILGLSYDVPRTCGVTIIAQIHPCNILQTDQHVWVVPPERTYRLILLISRDEGNYDAAVDTGIPTGLDNSITTEYINLDSVSMMPFPV